MSFDYNEYYQALVLGPASFLAFGFVIFVLGIIFQIKPQLVPRKIKEQFKYAGLLISVLALLISLFIVTTTSHFTLIYDKEEQVVETNGTITKIDFDRYHMKMYYENEFANPMYIIINDRTYYIMTIGDFEVGDDVTIEYLPKSMIIMKIESSE